MSSRPLPHFLAKNPQESARRFIYGVGCLKTGLEKLLELDPKLTAIRERKLKEINSIITKEIPVVPFYYITKL